MMSVYINVFLLSLPMLTAVENKTPELKKTSTFREHKNLPVYTPNTQDNIKRNDFAVNQPHSRRKRLVWITDDGRLALPPGTTLTFTPTIAMPLVRHPPDGFFSNVSISFPLTIDFDKLGLTDESNPLGDLPPIFTRQFGRSTGRALGDYVANYLQHKSKRDLAAQSKSAVHDSHGFRIRQETKEDENLELPRLPERFKYAFHGGERVILYGIVEDLLGTFGMNGRACLLRIICEIHSKRINHFGVFGEIMKLFLTATSSPYADLIPEYVNAQEIGEGRKPPGECFPYYKGCSKSIFRTAENNKYSASHMGEYGKSHENEVIAQNHHTKLLRFSMKTTEKYTEKQKQFSM
ncbi:uncharacterized protein [Eurosta solidaginis]|uniref:uncharacterized protein n=1 Tax=Eurosta solidaginis TaxID=178769 RepID=UPI003530D322